MEARGERRKAQVNRLLFFLLLSPSHRFQFDSGSGSASGYRTGGGFFRLDDAAATTVAPFKAEYGYPVAQAPAEYHCQGPYPGKEEERINPVWSRSGFDEYLAEETDEASPCAHHVARETGVNVLVESGAPLPPLPTVLRPRDTIVYAHGNNKILDWNSFVLSNLTVTALSLVDPLAAALLHRRFVCHVMKYTRCREERYVQHLRHARLLKCPGRPNCASAEGVKGGSSKTGWPDSV